MEDLAVMGGIVLIMIIAFLILVWREDKRREREDGS